MADKWPVTSRTDVLPSKNSFPEKKHGESFNTAYNPPNNPKKDHQPTSYNVTADYCGGENEDDSY